MLIRLFSYITIGGYMKIEKISLHHFFIFFNITYLHNVEFTKDGLISMVKNLLWKLKDQLMLRGFYKVKVYAHQKVGLFLDLYQLEEFEYEDSFDLRVFVFFDEKIYFKTKDFFVLPKNAPIYFDGSYFYCDVNYMDNFLSVVEFGSILYGKELYQVMSRWQKC